MTKQKVVIIGAGGFGRELLDIFEASNQEKLQYEILGFIVQKEYSKPGEIINDYPVLGDFDWLEKNSKNVYAICAVGAPQHRHRLIEKASNCGVCFCSVIHPLAYKSRWVNIGVGSVVAAGCILTTQIKVGNHVHINLDCTIGHDAILEEYVTLAPGIHISGKVVIGAGSYIGTGANVIEKVSVGEWSIIGAGSTIIRDVPANSTVVGNPGKVIKERLTGWQFEL